MGKEVKISEIFFSIQGEGIYSGIPMVFVRTQGCNLLNHCNYCDTSHAWDGNLGTEIGIEDIGKQVNKLDPRFNSWVCITGGEPLSQPDLYSLVRELKRWGKHITIETNGSINPPKWYTIVDSWNTDIKCPSSGVCGISREEWFSTRFCDQIKFVVGNKDDLDFASEMIDRHAADLPIVLVSPVFPRNYNEVGSTEFMQEVAEFCKAKKVRFSLQIHKVIWGNRKGV